jgi:putative sigma-54 modulation protein
MKIRLQRYELQIPGNDLFAKKQAKTFEEAIDSPSDALKKQITSAIKKR